jgi:hypothetical protein
MAAQTLLITAGDVLDVQLTSETVVIEGADRRHVEPGHITNRMRLFVRELEGGEKKYDFEETELGVRETQRVAIVRGKLKGEPEPVNLILFNLSSGEKDTFERGLAAYLARKPLFGPLWKAIGLSLLVALGYWLFNRDGGPMSIMLACMFAFMSFFAFWWGARIWDRLAEKMRYRAARQRFINEMTGRVRAYAPGVAPQAPTPDAQAAVAPTDTAARPAAT